jgi:hypothetical protein
MRAALDLLVGHAADPARDHGEAEAVTRKSRSGPVEVNTHPLGLP